MSSQQDTHILLIYTGGTIGMVKDYDAGVLVPFDFSDLENRIPELKQLDCRISTRSFAKPIDSSNMNTTHWVELASMIGEAYDDYDGFVILHGSDTMSYTGAALSYMLENLGKPVVLTGSQLPIGDLRTDAKENLITAIQIATLKDRSAPLIREVCLYFEYKLYRANRTTKINAEHFEAFASLNFPPLASSGVHLAVSREYLFRPPKGRKFKVHLEMDPNVVIIKLFPGMTEQVLRSILSSPGLKAVVLETYGAGNAPTEPWLLEALKDAMSSGIHIVNVTQCSGGSVSMGQYETSEALRKMRLISGRDITTEAAVTKLMYLLGQHVSAKSFRTIFETPLRGEMA